MSSNFRIEIPTNSHHYIDELARNPLVSSGLVDPREPEAALMQELYTGGVLVAFLVNDELERAGVPPQLFSFLGWVATLEPVTPGALAAETGMPPTTIRDYVRRLLERGDVRKVPNPADGRSYHLVLSAQGRRLVDRGLPAVVAAFLRVAPYLERPPAEYLTSAVEVRRALREALSASRMPRAVRRARS